MTPLASNTAVVAQIARQRPAPWDPDKARGQIDALRCKGVWLCSRYGRNAEIATMKAATEWLARHGPAGAAVVANTVEVFCDSKCGSSYSIDCTDACVPVLQGIADAWSKAVTAVSDGHNGLIVSAGRECAEAEAAWLDDEESPDFGPGGAA